MVLCKKLVYKEDKQTICLYGIITSETDLHIFFRTRDKEYMVARESILVLGDTTKIFDGAIR